MYNMTVNKIGDNIYNLVMNTQSVLCRTFMRFQEHYESPKFKGKVFTRRQYKEWYKKDRGTEIFTYEDDWTGFNFPSWVLKPFYAGLFDPILDCEKKLLDQFEKIKNKKFYVIGTLPCDKQILIHEIAHGLWDCNEEYRFEQQFIIDFHHIKPVDKLREHLLKMGYCQDVIEDEVHAYLMCEQEYMEWQGVYSKKFKSLEKRLTEVYNRYAPIKKEN